MGGNPIRRPIYRTLSLFDWIISPTKFVKSEKYAILVYFLQILLKSKFDLLILLVHDVGIWQVNKNSSVIPSVLGVFESKLSLYMPLFDIFDAKFALMEACQP